LVVLAGVSAAVVLTMAAATPVQNDGGSETADGRPNLNGIWQALNTANWDIQGHAAQAGPSQFGALFATPAGMGVVVGNEIPYQTWALRKKEENLTKRFAVDPEAKCYLPGVPRATYMPFPFQIVQGSNKIIMIYEFAAANRTIHLDSVPPPPAESWMGHSVGRWEKGSLIVDVTSQVDATWFDRTGNFHSDALHVVERYSRIDRDHLWYEVTIEDPKVFTRPWKIAMPLYRRVECNIQLLEFKCVEFSEELLYGHLRKNRRK
jgi:hypothetical protein